MVRGVAMAEIFRLLSAKKETILRLSFGVLLGLAGSVPAVQAQTLAQDSGTVQQASYGRGRDCYPQYYQDCQPNTADNLGADGDGDGDGQGATDPVVPFGEEDLYASNDTMANSPSSIAPNMIGDLLATGPLFYDIINTTSVPLAAGDRRFKISDNNNPLPMDRILFNYHNFDDGVLGGDGNLYDVNRYTFGIEKTFWDGMASFEFRAPFASGLAATQTVGTTTQGVEFGNLTGVLKVLIFQTDTTIVSSGIATTFATARDAHIIDGIEVARIENEATFLQPFIGISHMNCNGCFVTFFGAADFDVTGDSVSLLGQGLVAGSAQQYYNQTLLMADLAVGKWLYRDPCGCRIINGVAPAVELHYTTTSTATDVVTFAGRTVTNPDNRVDILNLVVGVHFLVGQRNMLTVTGGAPLRTGGDRYYDSEFGVRFNHYY
jgi:hypothetical protein